MSSVPPLSQAPPTTSLRAIWDIYASAWEDISSEERTRRLELACTEQCTYLAAPCDLKSRAELKTFIDQFRSGAPKGSYFTTTWFIEHHNTVLGHFVLHSATGEPISEGVDRTVFAADGRMQTISAFFQKPHPEADATSAKRGIWRRYTSAWEPCLPQERQAHLEAAVSTEVTFCGPANQGSGISWLVQLTTQFQIDYPGATFRQDAFWEHHDDSLVDWTIMSTDGKEVLKGHSYARYNQKTAKILDLAGYW